jgi:ferredoxin-NADP reductase
MLNTSFDSLLFFLYVRLVDERQAIGIRDIERLDQIFAKPSLLGVSILDSSIKQLSTEYQSYWRAYQQGNLAASDAQLPALLDAALSSNASVSWVELRNGLVEWIRFFCTSNNLLAKLNLKDVGKKSRFARADQLTDLLMAWNPAGELVSKSADAVDEASAKALKQHRNQLHQFIGSEVAAKDQLALLAKGNHRLVCTHVRQENHRVKTFTFVSPDLSAWVFQPGQFLTFEIPAAEGLLRRSYSISSSPAQPYAIEVTVKQVPGGKASSWMHEHMKVGKDIAVHGPHGNFSILKSIDRTKVALFSAGVGITPLMSMLNWLSHTRHDLDVVLINRVHSHEDHIFMDELIALGSNPSMNLRQYTLATQREGDWHDALGLIDLHKGVSITPELIEDLVPDILERDVFLCGPHAFKDSVLAALQFLNFDASRFYSESFGGLNQNPQAWSEDGHAQSVGSMISTSLKRLDREIAPENLCEIEFTKSGKTVACEKGEFILDVAEYNGINIPNSCRTGTCGTCKCHLDSGSVAMDSEDGLSPADLVAGNVLTCVGRVRSKKVVIDA